VETALKRPADLFAGLPFRTLTELRESDVAVISAAEASPYDPTNPSHSARAPEAIRQASLRFARQLGQFDFDLEAVLWESRTKFADVGVIPTDVAAAAANREKIQGAVHAMNVRGVKSVLIGGDDSVPIPWIAGHQAGGPYTVLQIDAHADWGDEIQDNRFGYGSTMRRVSEMPWVQGMVQVGLRGLGSGGAWQIQDARNWGSHLVTMKTVRSEGLAPAIEAIPGGAKVLVSIDCDGLDPAGFPAVNMPTPGGLSYGQLIDLFSAVSKKAEIAGAAVVEFVPERDDRFCLSALTAARLVAVLMGLMVR
jgi:agmatinase